MHWSFASPWADPEYTPSETHGNPVEMVVMVQYWYSFFSSRGRGVVYFGSIFFLDHGDIPTGFVLGSATGKVKSTLPVNLVDL